MMSSVLGASAYVIGIVVFLGAAVVYLRGSKDKGTIATLEASNRALIERVTVLETNEARLATRVAHLEAENSTLLAQRPSADAIAALARQVADLAEKQVTGVSHQLTKHDRDVKALLGKARP